ncbi:MAG: hypothetical protein ACTSQG_10230 [Promethearchaeota archaeon]
MEFYRLVDERNNHNQRYIKYNKELIDLHLKIEKFVEEQLSKISKTSTKNYGIDFKKTAKFSKKHPRKIGL